MDTNLRMLSASCGIGFIFLSLSQFSNNEVHRPILTVNVKDLYKKSVQYDLENNKINESDASHILDKADKYLLEIANRKDRPVIIDSGSVYTGADADMTDLVFKLALEDVLANKENNEVGDNGS